MTVVASLHYMHERHDKTHPMRWATRSSGIVLGMIINVIMVIKISVHGD